jgi:hypothetical protein
MPVARALVTLGDAVMRADSWRDGRSLADLGLADVDLAGLDAHLANG